MAFDLTRALDLARSTGVLQLSSLGLISLPRAMFDPTFVHLIRRLDVSGNDLRSIPPAIGLLRNVEVLFLNGNPLASIPDEIEGCISLKVLDLRDTLVSSLPPSLGKLPSIVDINLLNTRLDPVVQDLYARGGVLKLLSYLSERDARRDLEEALRATLTVDIYSESADTVQGKERVARLVADCMAEWPSNAENGELRTVVRNAGRLFNVDLYSASSSEVRAKLLELQRDNYRKALAADIELKMRAMYYGRIDVSRVEGTVKDIMANLPELEDAQFLLDNASKLFPSEAKEIKGSILFKDLVNLRQAMLEDRAAAVSTLQKSLMIVYPDREPHHVEHLTRAVARLLRQADDIRMLASDAGELFPPEFNAAKPKVIYKAFKESKKEKGL
jgi:hypothetical protein